MKLLNTIEQKSILVIGDIMLDTYLNGDINRISPEAPVPVFKKINKYNVLGGAANVAANLVAANQNVSMMAMVGSDANGEELRNKLEEYGINTDLIISVNRDTTVKIRFLASNNQQVLRLDIEDTNELGKDNCEKLLELLEDKIKQFHMILLSDYLKGLLSYGFTQGILQLAKKYHIPAIVDVKDPNVSKYKGAYLLKPNLKEIRELTNMPARTEAEIIEASEHLKELCNCKYVLTTCGAKGMVLVGDGEPYFIAAAGQEVFDVTGAGDTTIAYLATCMVNGFNIRKSVEIANCAAGIQVGKVGTASVCWREIKEYLTAQKCDIVYKILNDNAVKTFRQNHLNQKIVFTNGCFDIIHVGHIRYLQEAAKLGDILVVGLNSDASVKRLKGSKRPINSEYDRAEILCAFNFIDYVILFEEDTPYNLISIIQPDILVKGGDYNSDEIVGKDIVESHGGELVLIPFVEGKSTTNMIQKIKE